MISNLLLALILVPAGAGLLVLLLPKRVRLPEAISLLAATATMVIAFLCSRRLTIGFSLPPPFGSSAPLNWLRVQLRADTLSGFMIILASFFSVLVVMHSLHFMERHARLREYYAYLLWTLGAANGALLSDSFLAFIFFWGVLAIMLYLLVGIDDGPNSQRAATKSFIIVGGADLLTLLGLVILLHVSGGVSFSGIAADPVPATGLGCTAFLLVLVGALAKAGAVPFHTWVPASAEAAPAGVMAYLPASLDKLLGIYLLARMSLYVFELNFALGLVMMVIGAVTIVVGVLMAVVQRDLRKLLSFHAVGQAGYMVLGIGTATPIGVIGGLFHMLNDAVYMCCLFLCGGNVEHRTGRRDLAKLGGLAKLMPVTFLAFLVGALSISGIPPLNGFYSKWMIYQGTIEAAKWMPFQQAIRGGTEGVTNPLWPFFLLVAVFGSALILASFIKVLYSVFLGETPADLGEPRDVEDTMAAPVITLAGLCVLCGIFAAIPLNWVCAALPGKVSAEPLGLWMPGLATCLLILSLLAGALVYWLANRDRVEEADVFLGGERVETERTRVLGTHFYSTLKTIPPLKFMFDRGERGTFDIYVILENIGAAFVRLFRGAHTGVLTMYLIWIALGMAVLLFGLVGMT